MKNPLPILITLIVLIMLVVAVYVIGRVQGKNRGKRGQAELPNNGQGIPGGWDPAPLSGRLHEVLKGVNASRLFFLDNRDLVLSDLLNLATDDMFAAVNNHFLVNYGNGETLWEWIQDEWWIDDDIYDGLQVRFNNLTLAQ